MILAIVIGYLYSIILVFIINLSFLIKIATVGSTLVFFTLYYLNRFKQIKISIINALFFIFISGHFSFYFITNNGTYGPMVYYYLTFLIFLTGLQFKKALYIIIFGLVNILVLFYIEYISPDKIKNYDNLFSRLV